MKNNLSLTECSILIRLFLSNLYKENNLTISKIAFHLSINRLNPTFTNLVKYLKKEEIIVETGEIIGSSKIIILNNKKLDELLYEQEKLKIFEEYFGPNLF